MKLMPGHPLLESLDRLLREVASLSMTDLTAIDRWLDQAAKTASQIPDELQRFAWWTLYADALSRRTGLSLSCVGAMLQAKMGGSLAPADADALVLDHSRCS